ncbi:MAG: copper homeostasis protein CutC [Armatimonadota bacterium]
MSVIHELCCGTVDEIELAAAIGVDRIELCSGLACGGLTPSPAMLHRAKELGLETIAMVRSREGGFVYSQDEFRTMLRDAKWLVEEGADGLVFGFLTESGELDAHRTNLMVEVTGARFTMMHRASDASTNLNQTVEALINLGVDRVLTSGQGGNAENGTVKLKELTERFGGHIQVVAGGGIRPDNVIQMVKDSLVPAIHYAARKNVDSPGYAGVSDPTPDAEMIREMKAKLEAYSSSLNA